MINRPSIIHVLLVDDHSIVRRGLRAILEGHQDIQCSEAVNAEDALRKLGTGGVFNVVLLDINLPGMSGLDALTLIHKQYPDTAVLLLSLYPAEQYLHRSMRMGARGYLSKSSPPEEIMEAIQLAASGKFYLPEGTYPHISETSLSTGQLFLHEGLSNREFEILCMLGRGKSVTEIAQMLDLSSKTVSTYRERILLKMNFSGNFDIMRYVLQEGLLR